MKKPVLNFQIPEWMMKDMEHLKRCDQLVKMLIKRFSDSYELIITPWNLQGEGAVTFTIAPGADIDEFIQKLISYAEHEYMTLAKKIIDSDPKEGKQDGISGFNSPMDGSQHEGS